MVLTEKIKRGLIPFIYILAMAAAFLSGWKSPYYNWDMLCYMGSVVSFEETDPQTVYRTVMDAAKAEIPGWIYDQHSKNALSAEYTAYMDQVPLCQIKPLYTGSAWVLHKLGVPLAESTWRISDISFLILAVIMFLWKPQFLPRNAWLLLSLLICFAWEFPIATVAKLSTPDAMSTMLSITAFYALLQKRSVLAFCVLGVLSTLARPDAMIIFSGATLYFAFLSPKEWRWSKLSAVLMLVALVISYSAFKMAFGGYTFAQYFIHSLVSTSQHPGRITQELTLQLYWWIFSGSFMLFFSQSRVLTLVFISLLAFVALYLKPHPERRIWRDMLLLTIAAWGLRFLMWPSWGDFRFYYTYSILVLFTAGEAIGPFAHALWKKIITMREDDLTQHAAKKADS